LINGEWKNFRLKGFIISKKGIRDIEFKSTQITDYRSATESPKVTSVIIKKIDTDKNKAFTIT
jgi:hypothetical protein